MALPFLQAGYGVFDTKLLGICLQFHSDSLDAFEKWRSFATSESLVLANLDPRSLHDLALASTQCHEFRHLHDFVLSTHGNQIFRLRLAAMLHSMQSIATDLSRLPVPTPLLRWARMPQAEQRSEEELWGQRVLPLDYLDLAMLQVAENYYGQLRACLVAESSLQVVDLYEASAILAQVCYLHRIGGEGSARRFWNAILGGAVPSRYAQVLTMLRDFWHGSGRKVDFLEFAAVVSWSLLGTFGKRPTDDQPTQRFLRLLHLFMRTGAPDFGSGLKDVYAQWDAALEYTPIEDAIRENIAENEKLVAELDNVPPIRGDTLLSTVVESYRLGIRALTAANRAMAAAYIEAPESYVYPDEYIVNRKTIQAPVRVDFLGGLGYHSDALRSCGFEVWVEVADSRSGKNAALSAFLHPEGCAAIDGQVASRVASHIMMSDYLFSALSRSDMDFRLARQMLRDIGITTLELV